MLQEKGGQGPIVKFCLEQTVNSVGNIKLSQAWHVKGAGVIVLGTQP